MTEQQMKNNVDMSRRLAKIASILRQKLDDKYLDFVTKWSTAGVAFDDMPSGAKQVITDAEKEYKKYNS